MCNAEKLHDIIHKNQDEIKNRSEQIKNLRDDYSLESDLGMTIAQIDYEIDRHEKMIRKCSKNIQKAEKALCH